MKRKWLTALIIAVLVLLLVVTSTLLVMRNNELQRMQSIKRSEMEVFRGQIVLHSEALYEHLDTALQTGDPIGGLNPWWRADVIWVATSELAQDLLAFTEYTKESLEVREQLSAMLQVCRTALGSEREMTQDEQVLATFLCDLLQQILRSFSSEQTEDLHSELQMVEVSFAALAAEMEESKIYERFLEEINGRW